MTFTARQVFTLGVMMMLLAFLASALGVYAERQTDLQLEGNQLRSDEAFQIEADVSSVVAAVRNSEGRAWAFVPTDWGERTQVLAAHDVGEVPVPFHDGPGFSPGGMGEALVGSDVETRRSHGEESVALGDRAFRVVGVLGARDESALSDMILIHDDALLVDRENRTLTVDGPDGRLISLQQWGSAGIENSETGALRRTNVDFVSPQILLFGTVLTVAGWACAGLLAARWSGPAMQVRILRGARTGRVLAEFATTTTALTVAASMLVLVGWALVGHHFPWTQTVIVTLLAAAITATVLTLAVTAREST